MAELFLNSAVNVLDMVGPRSVGYEKNRSSKQDRSVGTSKANMRERREVRT